MVLRATGALCARLRSRDWMLLEGQGGVRVHSRAAPLVILGTGLEAGRPAGGSGLWSVHEV